MSEAYIEVSLDEWQSLTTRLAQAEQRLVAAIPTGGRDLALTLFERIESLEAQLEAARGEVAGLRGLLTELHQAVKLAYDRGVVVFPSYTGLMSDISDFLLREQLSAKEGEKS